MQIISILLKKWEGLVDVMMMSGGHGLAQHGRGLKEC